MQNSSNSQHRVCPRGAGYYVWQEGDTLASVSLAQGTTAQAITVLNPGVDFSSLPAGTEICLPSNVYTCISGLPLADPLGGFRHKQDSTLVAEQTTIY